MSLIHLNNECEVASAQPAKSPAPAPSLMLAPTDGAQPDLDPAASIEGAPISHDMRINADDFWRRLGL